MVAATETTGTILTMTMSSSALDLDGSLDVKE